MDKSIDKETKEILSENEKIASFVGSDPWKIIKKKLYSKLITLDSVSAIPKNDRSFEEVGRDAAMREAVVKIVTDWILEIEGIASNESSIASLMKEAREDSILQFFES